jgi:hypothetical protein
VKLSADQGRKFVENLSEHVKECPACKGMEMFTMDLVIDVREFHEDGVIGGRGLAYPAVLAVCKACSYMMPFSVLSMGLMSKDELKGGSAVEGD